jgi:predicted S18 family serine protease
MNPVERLLQEEVTHFLDRLAASMPPDGVASHALTAAARTRLDEAEAQLAQARASLVEGYGRWRRALEDVENLWALAAWRSTAAEEASEHPAPLAA